MIPLKNKPNTNAVTTAYPYGSLRDNLGDNTGTPVNKLVQEDLHQFFEKMFAQSGITANGLPDNATNGWQLFEALLATQGGNVAPVYTGDYGSNSSNPVQVRRIPGRMVLLTGRVDSAGAADVAAGSSTLMFTLPAGYRPAYPKDKQVFSATNNKFYRLRIETTGGVFLIADSSPTPSYNHRMDITFALD